MVKTPKSEAAAPRELAPTQNVLDKSVSDVEQFGQDGLVVATAEGPGDAHVELPPRTVQEMINHRRMLKGMLDFTEQSLRRAGIKV